MDELVFAGVGERLNRATRASDDALEHALRTSRAADLPEIQVQPSLGRQLTVLARAIGARRILEIGVLGGYSAICLARALPEDGELIGLEIREEAARVARENIEFAGLADRSEIRVGVAMDLLRAMDGPDFDLVFIDADKENTLPYYEWAMSHTRSGGIIIVDNVVRDGNILDDTSGDPSVLGTRRFLDRLETDDRVESFAMQTVSEKGYDGHAVMLVK